MATVRFNLDQLLRQLAAKNNRDYEKSYVADKSGVSRTTISGIVNGNTTRVDLETLAKLVTFFSSEGMKIDVGDLFSISD